MNKVKLSLNMSNVIFNWTFAFWYLTEIIFSANIEEIFGIPISVWNEITSWMVLILLMVQIMFLQSYTLNQLLVILGITFFFGLSVILSHNRQLFSAWLFIVAAKNINFEKIIFLARNIIFTAVNGIIIFRLMGILDDYTIYRFGMERYSLGFAHPNHLGLWILQFVLCSVYLKRRNVGLCEMLMILFAAVFCYLVPNSQTASLSLGILFILLGGYILTNKYIVVKNKLFVNGIIIISAVVNIGSIVLSLIDLLRFPVLCAIDSLLSSRFFHCHKAYLLYGIKIFGNRIYISEQERALVGMNQHLFLDNSYMNLILRYGIVTWMIYSIMYLMSMIKQKNEGNDIMVIILFLYTLYGIMEKGFYAITYNIFILTLSFLLYSQNTDKIFKIHS